MIKLIDLLREIKVNDPNDKIETLLNEEEYTTSQGLKFKLKTFGYKKGGESFYYYMQTFVNYKGKDLIGSPRGIPGVSVGGFYYTLKPSINKVKKWLDKNGEKLINNEIKYWKD